MRFYAFEYFPWLPWALLAAALLMVVLLVLAIRAKRRLWKILLGLCVPLPIIVSCTGFTIATFYHPPLVNVPAPVPDSASLALLSRDPSQSFQTLKVLDARTGALRWTRPIDEGTMSPVADDHAIYLVSYTHAVNPTVVAIRTSDGTELWRTPLTYPDQPQRPMAVAAPPVVSDGMVFVSAYIPSGLSGAGAVFAIHATTGTLTWSMPLEDFLEDDLARPMAAGQGMVYVGSPAGTLSAFRGSDGVLVWKQHVFPDGMGQVMPIFAGGQVYFIDDRSKSVVALHAHDGSIAWSRALPEDQLDSLDNPLSMGASGVYFHSSEETDHGEREFLNAVSAQTGQLQWRYPVVNASGSRAVEAGALVYLASRAYLDAVRVSDGHRVWRHSSNANVGFDAPIIANDTLFVESLVVYPHVGTSCPPDCEPPSAVNALNAATGSLYWRVAETGIVPAGLLLVRTDAP